LGKAGEPVVHQTQPNFEIGQAIHLRSGRDVTFISTGATLPLVVEAANQLADQGLSCGVLSVPTLKPLDKTSLLQVARQSTRLVTVEEHTTLGGLGGAVAEVLTEVRLDGRGLLRLGIPDIIIKVAGSQDYLRRQAGLAPDQLVQSILSEVVAREV
jgi:transketolase